MLFQVLIDWIKANAKREEGQAMAEYGLILALIAVVVIAAVTLIGTNLNVKFGAVSDALKTVVP
ncbi:MAG: Flp family type IVb pilin [Gaiellaceae bacterium]